LANPPHEAKSKELSPKLYAPPDCSAGKVVDERFDP